MKKVLFITDANSSIGAGHLKRSLSLCDAFLSIGYEINICIGSTEYDEAKNWVDCEYQFLKIDNSIQLDYFIKIHSPILVIIDLPEIEKYYFIAEYFGKINFNLRLVVFDRFFENKFKYFRIIKPHINNLFKNKRELYGGMYQTFSKKLQGAKKNILEIDSIKIITISMGGADPYQVSGLILNSLTEVKDIESINCVVGPFYGEENKKNLRKIEERCKNVKLHFNLPDLTDLYEISDLVIISGGQTKYEAMYMGIPSIVIANSDEEYEYSLYYYKKMALFLFGKSCSFNEKNFINKIQFIKNDIQYLNLIKKNALNIFDGIGAMRIAKEINDSIFKVG